ncbi:CBS domain-containing protein [Actibacterium lipolyticum]|uniref:Hypoxic response protein 1 n=1 Tax=Actibacterium lipolyticum TaxID=1524263 RepID=A0A238L7B6_9RHOB|nr:CBS domain-containing protein [Actibacterium lipolyticum]SMX50985.1 Hypoxic response protein 1 [Actibacterium lipolyticum]
MKTLRNILDEKGAEVFSVAPNDTVFDAIKAMADHDIGALVVLDREILVGIVTERHYARRVFLKGKSSPKTQVKDIMTTPVVCADPSQSTDQGLALLTEKKIRHLPVISENQVIGIVSIGDLVKSKISDQKFVIDQLERYISG